VSLEGLTIKYIGSAEKVIKELQKITMPIAMTEAAVSDVLSWAANYLEDAKYYRLEGKLETSLTSIAYCEGLLDALRLLGAVKFEWPTSQEKER
jgi:hypothetical protein